MISFLFRGVYSINQIGKTRFMKQVLQTVGFNFRAAEIELTTQIPRNMAVINQTVE
jgi:hypothetical protein